MPSPWPWRRRARCIGGMVLFLAAGSAVDSGVATTNLTATALAAVREVVPEGETAPATIEDDDAATGPTARFVSFPDSHDGTAFEVPLEFSEEIEGIEYAWVRDTLVSATGARVTAARRAESGANLGWVLTVAPESAGSAATLSVAAGTELPDGRALSAGDSVRVLGQRSLSASITGAENAVAEGMPALFTVTLDAAAVDPLEVLVSVTETGAVLAGSAPTTVTLPPARPRRRYACRRTTTRWKSRTAR